MKIVIPVTPDGQVDPRWGRAPRVAVATITDGSITDWQEHAVGWDVLHDEGTEGSHHARVVRFLREQGVDAVVAGGMGGGMARTISRMGLPVWPVTDPDARTSVELAVAARASGVQGGSAG